MRGDLFDGAGYIGEVAGAVGAQGVDVFRRADGTVDHRALAGLELEVEAHGFERQQKIGKDDGRVHAQLFSGGDGDLGGQFRMLADFHKGVVLADVAVLLHVAAGLAQKPDRGAIDRAAETGAEEAAAVEDGFRGGGVLVGQFHIVSILPGKADRCGGQETHPPHSPFLVQAPFFFSISIVAPLPQRRPHTKLKEARA